MKVFKDNSLYVQLDDLNFLFHQNISMPRTVIEKVFSGKMGTFIVTDSNRYDFIRFDDEEAINYFYSLNWIINYDSVKDLTMNELMEMGQKLSVLRNERASYFNGLSDLEKENNMELVEECEFLMFKIYSLADYIHYFNGELKIPFLDEINKSVKHEEVGGIKKMIKKFFKREDYSKK